MTGVIAAVYARARRGWQWLGGDAEGASLVEYILLLALVAIVTVAGVQQLGRSAKQALNRIGLAMPSSEGGNSDGAAPESGSGISPGSGNGGGGSGVGNGSGNGHGGGNGNGTGNGNGGGNGNGNGGSGGNGGGGGLRPPPPLTPR